MWADMASADGGLKCPPASDSETPGNPGDSSRKGKTSSAGAKPACVWVPRPDYQAGAGQPVDGKGGRWYQKFCAFGKYQTLADFQRAIDSFDLMNTHQTNLLQRAGLEVRYFTTPPEIPRRTPQQVMASVVDSLPFPKTFIRVNPVANKLVVDLPTWVWLTDESGRFDPQRYGQKSTMVEIEGYQLQWAIVPQMTITPGDTSPEQACTGAGVPWSASAEGDPGACTVTYDTSGNYTLAASVGWTVQWWLGGVRQDDIPGPTNTATSPVTVLEIHTLNR